MVFGNDTATGNTAGQQFVEGMPVFDAGDEKIGTVGAYDAQGQYLVVHKGWFFPRDVNVPLQVVARSDADGVYLNLYKDEVMNEDWNAPPVHDISTGSALAGATDTATQMQDYPPEGAAEPDAPAGAGSGEMRVPVQSEYAEVGPDTFAEKDIDIPVMGEELIAGKRAIVTEEVRLRKQVVTEEQQVSDMVRRERVTVEGADEAYGADLDAHDSVYKGK